MGDRLYTRPPAAPYYSQPAHVLALQHTDSQTRMLFNSSIKKGDGAKFGRFESVVGTARWLFIKALLLLTDFALTLNSFKSHRFWHVKEDEGGFLVSNRWQMGKLRLWFANALLGTDAA